MMKSDRARTMPGIFDPPVPENFHPNMRDDSLMPDSNAKEITTTPQSVGNFGGENQGFWRGRDVSASATRIAPAVKGRPQSPEDGLVKQGRRSPK